MSDIVKVIELTKEEIVACFDSDDASYDAWLDLISRKTIGSEGGLVNMYIKTVEPMRVEVSGDYDD